MTKKELIDAICTDAKVGATKKDVEAIINATFDNIKKTVRKDKRFAFPGFGTFSVRQRKARTGVNPRTRETIKIKASKTVGFKPAREFKDKL
ncbi:MAG: HU family DNA-binding protein [Myxococcota bacterium]